jgi:hypothetical protein
MARHGTDFSCKGSVANTHERASVARTAATVFLFDCAVIVTADGIDTELAGPSDLVIASPQDGESEIVAS